jgi:hypothetical protein
MRKGFENVRMGLPGKRGSIPVRFDFRTSEFTHA